MPDHPALNYPNKITEKDFEGWVQERSTYQAAANWISHYEMPLGMNDTGEQESNGSLAIAKYGKGNFVYAGLVFFQAIACRCSRCIQVNGEFIALPKNK